MDTNLRADVVFVGGGPIGCWTALQIKKRNPEASIVIYERKPVYERDHILSISRDSLFQWSKGSEGEADFLKAIFNAQATCSIAAGLNGGLKPGEPKPQVDLEHVPHNRFSYWRNLPKVLDIRTIDYESILKEECEKAGIKFVYEKIDDPDQVMDRHPECKTFIAADGANSKMRPSRISCLAWVSANEAICSFGTIMKCTGATGWMSWKAITSLSS